MTVLVDTVKELEPAELEQYWRAAARATADGGGFGWVQPPTLEAFSLHLRAVLDDPLRDLFLARSGKAVIGSVQLARRGVSSESRRHSATVLALFVAPEHRRRGCARALMAEVEKQALARGVNQLDLAVRAEQTAAIELYRSLGYVLWGTHPRYARVDGAYVPGLQFYKQLD